MCTSPLVVFRKNPHYNSAVSPCALPLHSRVRGYLLYNDIKSRYQLDFRKPGFKFDVKNFYDNYYYSSALVPCGKCADCLKKRQSDLAARCACEANRCGSMCFVTLTYRNECLPIAALLEAVDKETGEIFHSYSLSQCERDVDDDVFRGLLNTHAEDSIRQVYKDLVDDGVFLWRISFTYSLNNRDVRLWLKSARVAYEREHGFKLPDFKYVAVGEYGNRTHRPHYHIGFFGLTRKQVDWLVSRWQYGFTYVQQVDAVNKDGSDGFMLASKYIGKYMSKGQFECDAVKCGYAFKGRLMSSKGLGGSLNSSLVSYFRCYDVIGEYDIMRPLSKDKLDKILPILSKRMSLTIGKSIFVLPKRFIHQIWFVKDAENRFKSSIVRKQISFALQHDFLDDFVRKLRQSYPNLTEREIISKMLEFKCNQELCLSLKNKRGMQSLQKFYLTSKF